MWRRYRKLETVHLSPSFCVFADEDLNNHFQRMLTREIPFMVYPPRKMIELAWRLPAWRRLILASTRVIR